MERVICSFCPNFAYLVKICLLSSDSIFLAYTISYLRVWVRKKDDGLTHSQKCRELFRNESFYEETSGNRNSIDEDDGEL